MLRQHSKGDTVKVDRRQAFDIKSLIESNEDTTVEQKREHSSSDVREEGTQGCPQSHKRHLYQSYATASHECFRHNYLDRNCLPSCYHRVARKKPPFDIPVEHSLGSRVAMPPVHNVQPAFESRGECHESQTVFHSNRERFLPISDSFSIVPPSSIAASTQKTCHHFYGNYLGSQQMDKHYGKAAINLT